MDWIIPRSVVELIAGHTDPQHMGMLMSVCKYMHSLLQESQIGWFLIGEQICGTHHWERALKCRHPKELPSSFTRRIMCPWLQPPRIFDIFPPHAVALLPKDSETRVWQISLDEGDLEISAQSLTAEGGYGYWFDENPLGNINTEYRIPARPLDTDGMLKETGGRWRTYYVCRSLLDIIRATVYTPPHTPDLTFRYSDESGSYWSLHSGVVVAAFSDPYNDTGGLCFFSVRTRRLIHFMHVPGDTNTSERMMLYRPGEMWVLETWADPSRVLYFGPSAHAPPLAAPATANTAPY